MTHATPPVITLRDVSKVYKLYDQPSDRIKETFHPFKKQYHKDFHALDKISFDILPGESVALVGRNGSGKSTLLQLICGVLRQSNGAIDVRGRIAPLLELGGGFNPEFTGLQNIYLQAAILGMDKTETTSRIQDILAFAELGDFINQPVKLYSSGMYVRLAFAVAVMADPEILIVDEALAVGDAAFQRKCFSRIWSFLERGKTLLFVSHSQQMVMELCDRAILLDQGELLLDGDPKYVLDHYQKLLFCKEERRSDVRAAIQLMQNDPDRATALLLEQEPHAAEQVREGKYHGAIKTCDDTWNRPAISIVTDAEDIFDPDLAPKSTVEYPSTGAHISDPRLETSDGRRVNNVRRGVTYYYTYDCRFERDFDGVRFGAMVKTVTGFELCGLVSHPLGYGAPHIAAGSIVRVRLPFRMALAPGSYFMNAGVTAMIAGEEDYLHRIVDAFMFFVMPEKDLYFNMYLDLTAGELPELSYIDKH